VIYYQLIAERLFSDNVIVDKLSGLVDVR